MSLLNDRKENLLKDVLRFLERINETIGEKTNEYTWREASELIYQIENLFEVSIRYTDKQLKEIIKDRDN